MRRLLALAPPGLLDSGLASVAMFAGAAFALRFEIENLAAYSLIGAAFVSVTMVANQLVLRPIEIDTLPEPAHQRAAILKRSIPMALPFAVAAAALIPVLTAFNVPGTSFTRVLTWTAFAAAILSPIQDHLRRTLHLSDESWRAAGLSAIKAGVMITVVIVGLISGSIGPWVPFGGLLLGNIASVAAGLAMTKPWHGNARLKRSTIDLLRIGGPILLSVALEPASRFLSLMVADFVAGATVVAYFEAARVVAQPVMVLTIGLNGSLSPVAMEAGARRSLRQATNVRAMFAGIIAACAVVYLAFVTFGPTAAFMQGFAEKAYVVSGLIAVQVLGSALFGVSSPFALELMGAGEQRRLIKPDVLASIARVATAFLAGVIGAIALPIGLVVLSVTRLIGYSRSVAPLYRASKPVDTGASSVQSSWSIYWS